MCLISKTDIPLIAKKDIICYKILMEDNCSPYYYRNYIAAIKNSDIIQDKTPERIEPFGSVFKISRGFIHTYSELTNLKYELYSTQSALLILCKVYKCIIPKGSKYFVNITGQEYCSKQLKFIEECILSTIH